MAETASILSPTKTVLIPDPDAGCSLAESITAEQLAAWKARAPRRDRRDVRQHLGRGQGAHRLLLHLLERVGVVRHILDEHGRTRDPVRSRHVPRRLRRAHQLGRALHVWDGECHVHAGIRPADIAATRAAHPDAEFLIHPECGCSTSVMEYVAAGDIDADGVHMLSTGGMLDYAAHARPGSSAIVATEVGMLYPLRKAAPDVEFMPANAEASCRFMKMITLPKLRDALRDGVHEVRVPAATADAARLAIERMVAIS
jgi:quinolinate synthase